MEELAKVLEMPKPEKERRKRGEGRIWLVGRIWWIQFYSRGRQIRESSHSEKWVVADRLLRRRLGEVAAECFHRRALSVSRLKNCMTHSFPTIASTTRSPFGNERTAQSSCLVPES